MTRQPRDLLPQGAEPVEDGVRYRVWAPEKTNVEARVGYVGRIQEYTIKVMKEAKVNSSWVQPNEPWKMATREFVAGILDPRANRFRDGFLPLAERIAQLGAINSLTQTVLKATAPGVPDFYQGTELWDFSLVDPDNRGPVDYEARRAALASLDGTDPAALLREWRDGRIKLFLARTLLAFRREHPALFASGEFTPLTATGTFADCCVAFLRQHENQALMIIIPRVTSRLGASLTARLTAALT